MFWALIYLVQVLWIARLSPYVRGTVSQRNKDENLDQNVIDGFGHEWAAFDYAETETAEALDAQFAAYCAPKNVARSIRPGGVFLCYLYYNLENKPAYYKLIFKGVNVVRQIISASPQSVRRLSATIFAALVYWPLARLSKVLSKFGRDTSNLPLRHYADMPFVMLANDALDRFGTSLEQRFSKAEIIEMLRAADFDLATLKFSDKEPFWTFSIKKL